MNKYYATFLHNLGNADASFKSNHRVCLLFTRRFISELTELIPYSVYNSWPHFSGNSSYPVPDPNNPSQFSATIKFRDTHDKWEGEYGRLRREWCLHLARYFDNE